MDLHLHRVHVLVIIIIIIIPTATATTAAAVTVTDIDSPVSGKHCTNAGHINTLLIPLALIRSVAVANGKYPVT